MSNNSSSGPVAVAAAVTAAGVAVAAGATELHDSTIHAKSCYFHDPTFITVA